MGNNESRIEPGDILYRDNKQFGLVNHYGVYIGEQGVIDFTKEGVQLSSFGDFAGNYEIHLKRYDETRPKHEIVETALYYLKNEEEWGEYSLVLNNCEHFASFCATGEKKSGQVKKAVIAVAVGVGVAVGLTAMMLLMGNRDDEKEKEKEK